MKRILLLMGALSAFACGPQIDLAKAIAPESVTTGWTDGGGGAGKNRIVPVVSFRLKNVSDRRLGQLQVNAVFRRGADTAEWSAGYLPNAARELPPGAETGERTVAGQQGYTGTDDREAMLRNSHFVDATADLFVKAGSSQWTRIAEFPVARQLVNTP
jgi:hypothetical protein